MLIFLLSILQSCRGQGKYKLKKNLTKNIIQMQKPIHYMSQWMDRGFVDDPINIRCT